jgi:hypothetical protein
VSQLALVPREHQWSALMGASSGAWSSECGTYRRLLWRTFAIGGDAAPLGFIMLNPSTADALDDDPTIRRCLGFAYREGAGGIVVANLSPYRATDPRDLRRAHRAGVDVFDAERNENAIKMVRYHAPVVLAWGAGIPPWLDAAASYARMIAAPGPRHPLMVRNDQPLVRYP